VSADPVTFLTSPRRPRRLAGQPSAVRNWDVSSARPGAGDSLPLRFEEVFRRHVPYVGALILRLIGRPGDVDDVVQDVFIQAHRQLPHLRDPAAVRPWLRRIVVRRARRWLRTRWVQRRRRELDVSAQTDLIDRSASPEERAEIARVYRALDRMPRDERLAWVLRFVEGETLEAMADLLGCSLSTVQRRLRRAESKMDGNTGEVR
jgi:RNA polymerase sigma-70 factor (ECF subfamily)